MVVRLWESGEVVDVFLHPQHPLTQGLVAENQALDLELLQQLRQRENSDLLRLTYVGDATHEPILHRIAAQTSADIVILQGVNRPYQEHAVWPIDCRAGW